MKEPIVKKGSASDILPMLNKWKALFGVLLAIGTLIVIAGAFVTISSLKLGYIVIGIGLILLGLIMLFLPFATSLTFKLLGVVKGKVIVRIIGMLLVILGLFFILIKSF